jgi:signal transduction histidine kinase
VSADGDQTDPRARLIALAVHDLRNPLASILGNAEYLIQARELSADSREAAGDLLSGAQLLGRVLGHLRAINRALDGELRPDPGEVDVAQLASESARACEARARQGGIEVVTRISGEVVTHADRELLRQVLDELLDGALRNAPRGTAVEVSAAARGAVTLAVRDRRPAPEADELAGMFDLAAARRVGPLFCRMAIEALGGSIAASVDRGGFVTEIRLPLTPAGATAR